MAPWSGGVALLGPNTSKGEGCQSSGLGLSDDRETGSLGTKEHLPEFHSSHCQEHLRVKIFKDIFTYFESIRISGRASERPVAVE